MQGDNMYRFKAKLRPEWYEDGPCKVYTQEEIDEWERTNGTDARLAIARQDGLSHNDIMWLDNLALYREEEAFEDILSGMTEGSTHDSNE